MGKSSKRIQVNAQSPFATFSEQMPKTDMGICSKPAATLGGALWSFAQNYSFCVQSISDHPPMFPFVFWVRGWGWGVHALAIVTLQSYLKIPEM